MPCLKLIFLSGFLYTMLLVSSCGVPPECRNYVDEVYPDEQPDAAEMSDALKYRNTLLQRFGETSARVLNNESYHLLFYSAHGFGESIKLEQTDHGFYINVKWIAKEKRLRTGKNYRAAITKEEWQHFEYMITNSGFWTGKQFDTARKVLDGAVYFLEGTRPEAAICDRKSYQFIGRRSLEYDKIGELCSRIMKYEEELEHKYVPRN